MWFGLFDLCGFLLDSDGGGTAGPLGFARMTRFDGFGMVHFIHFSRLFIPSPGSF
jgi:hypothetical protein